MPETIFSKRWVWFSVVRTELQVLEKRNLYASESFTVLRCGQYAVCVLCGEEWKWVSKERTDTRTHTRTHARTHTRTRTHTHTHTHTHTSIQYITDHHSVSIELLSNDQRTAFSPLID